MYSSRFLLLIVFCSKKKRKMGLPRFPRHILWNVPFELGSIAPKATSIDQASPQALLLLNMIGFDYLKYHTFRSFQQQ